jgi:hypothetical protein
MTRTRAFASCMHKSAVGTKQTSAMGVAVASCTIVIPFHGREKRRIGLVPADLRGIDCVLALSDGRCSSGRSTRVGRSGCC